MYGCQLDIISSSTLLSLPTRCTYVALIVGKQYEKIKTVLIGDSVTDMLDIWISEKFPTARTLVN